MKARFLIYYILIAVSFTSCSIFGSDSNSTESRIIGNWQLVHTSGGYIGIDLTPNSAEFNETHLHFRPDHSFSISLNDSTIKKGTFSLSYKNGDSYVKYGNTNDDFFPNQYVRFETKDTLKLLDECADFFINTYKRMK